MTLRPSELPPDAGAWLKSLAGEARGEIRAAVGLGVVAGFATMAQMACLAYIIHDAVVLEYSAEALAPWFVGLTTALGARFSAQAAQAGYMARSSGAARSAARQQLMAAWRQAGPVRLMDESAASLSREWLDHVEALHGYYARYLPQLQLALLVPLVILSTLAWTDWLAAVFLLLAAPLIPLFMALVGMGAQNLNRRHFETIGRLSGQFLDRVRGLPTLQLFGQAAAEAEVLRERSEDYRQITMKTLRIAFLSSAVLEFFASVSIAVVAIYIGFGLLGYIEFGPAPSLTLFSGLFVLLLAPEFFQPLRQLAQHYHDRAAALGAAELILARLTSAARLAAAPAGKAPSVSATAARDEILLDHVCVDFPDGRQGLKDVFLRVNPGERIAITGPSGAGKSTLLNVLAGFITPTQGSVSVSGRPPGECPFGWLGQSPHVVHGTWADHLRLVAPDATDSQMIRALEWAGLAELLGSRSEGLASRISELGVGLSGGQARRLSLARLFLSDANLILLDEPTAGLDAHTEQLVLQALRKLAENGRTLVFVTHHESLLGLATRVVRMEQGTVCDG
ncbi:thiol reductant ABC exporter subunit CydD [Marinobacter sp.]|uniref:thiol reductant ABC exporter subunit CydD n=1 Tax=Marinobacter sp. TaxID=50741 RepID=UPI00384B62A8